MKPIMTIFAPVATRSGYGELAKDFCRSVIQADKYDIKIISAPWGGCPMTNLDPSNSDDKKILDRIVPNGPLQVPRQPEIHVHIGIPNEMQPWAKFNIIYTAGIESTTISREWVEACNRADLILASSNHSKQVIEGTVINEQDQNGNVIAVHRVTKPVEVLHCALDKNIFRVVNKETIPKKLMETLNAIPESFCYLFVGHWLKGGVGEDRKNVGMLVKIFCETFKDTDENIKPALILKTSGATFSYEDQTDILRKIRAIRESVKNAPNVYLLHGDLSLEEMNGLYNHPKVKAHVNFTKGEGFGLPLLEATASEKPVIASGWSGQLDFLDPDLAILVGGELRNIEPGAVWPGILIAESQWFNVDPPMASKALLFTMAHYDRLKENAKKLAQKNKEAFSTRAIKDRTMELLTKYVPAFLSGPAPLKLPTLKKLG